MTLQNEINKEVKEIEMNMLRERCSKLEDITKECWDNITIDEENRELIEEFLLEATHLSKKSLIQYTSALRIFAKWVMENLNNKKIYNIKKRDFLRFQNFLVRHGMSSNGIKLKRSAVSSFCNYLENYYFGEDDRFSNFRNFVKGVENPAPNKVYNKVLVTEDEYKLMKTTLLEDGRIRDYAMLVLAMECGLRGGEIIKMKKSEAYKTIPNNSTFVLTDVIFGKGRGGGKPLEYMMNQETLNALKMYADTRNDNSEWLFVTKYKGEINQVGENYFETVCREYLSDIVGRRINEHIFRASCTTHLLLRGVSEILVSKYVLHHEDLSTLKHYDLRDFEEEKNAIFANLK